MDDAGRVIGLYRRHGLAWAHDRRAEPFFEGGWLDRFMALLPDNPAVLDLGCGFGKPIAAYLVAHGCTVTGVDTAPDLLGLARADFPDHDWQCTDMRALSLDRVFNGILAWDSFFHLAPEDQRRMFAVFRPHAAPAAALMFTSGPAAGEAVGAYGGEPLYHASLDPAEYRALLGANGFIVQAHAAQDAACGGRTVWLAQLTKDRQSG